MRSALPSLPLATPPAQEAAWWLCGLPQHSGMPPPVTPTSPRGSAPSQAARPAPAIEGLAPPRVPILAPPGHPHPGTPAGPSCSPRLGAERIGLAAGLGSVPPACSPEPEVSRRGCLFISRCKCAPGRGEWRRPGLAPSPRTHAQPRCLRCPPGRALRRQRRALPGPPDFCYLLTIKVLRDAVCA